MRGWLLGSLLLFTACERSDSPQGAAEQPKAERSRPLARAGAPAPDFEVTAHSGDVVKLSSLRGRNVVLYFYPKDDTPGCTIEAQEIRDAWEAFQGTNTTVLGVSADDNDSHGRFARKHGLPFLLLPDPEHRIAQAYGVPIRLGVTKRVTFVIDGRGTIVRTFDDVNPNGHAEEILKVLASLDAASP